MTTNQTNIPEPTSRTEVVVGKRDGETVIAAWMDDDDTPWAMQYPDGGFQWCSWEILRLTLTDIRVVPMAGLEARPTKVANCARCDRIEAHALGIEGLLGRRRDQLAKARGEINRLTDRIAELESAKPEPGPWLRGDELAAIMPTLKAGDVAEMGYKGHTATGELWADRGLLVLWAITVRTFTGKPGPCVDALRIIERAPEPEPEWAEDHVVMVKFRERSGGGWKVARRDEDGEWITRDDVNSLPTDLLAERFEVRRLSPEAHAELLTIVRGEEA